MNKNKNVKITKNTLNQNESKQIQPPNFPNLSGRTKQYQSILDKIIMETEEVSSTKDSVMTMESFTNVSEENTQLLFHEINNNKKSNLTKDQVFKWFTLRLTNMNNSYMSMLHNYIKKVMNAHGTDKELDLEDFYYTINYFIYFYKVYRNFMEINTEFKISLCELEKNKSLLRFIEGSNFEEKMHNMGLPNNKKESKISYIDFIKYGYSFLNSFISNYLIQKSNKFRQSKIIQAIDVKIETSTHFLKEYVNQSVQSKFDYYSGSVISNLMSTLIKNTPCSNSTYVNMDSTILKVKEELRSMVEKTQIESKAREAFLRQEMDLLSTQLEEKDKKVEELDSYLKNSQLREATLSEQNVYLKKKLDYALQKCGELSTQLENQNIYSETSVIHEDSKEYLSERETVERNYYDKIENLETESKKLKTDLSDMKRMYVELNQVYDAQSHLIKEFKDKMVYDKVTSKLDVKSNNKHTFKLDMKSIKTYEDSDGTNNNDNDNENQNDTNNNNTKIPVPENQNIVYESKNQNYHKAISKPYQNIYTTTNPLDDIEHDDKKSSYLSDLIKRNVEIYDGHFKDIKSSQVNKRISRFELVSKSPLVRNSFSESSGLINNLSRNNTLTNLDIRNSRSSTIQYGNSLKTSEAIENSPYYNKYRYSKKYDTEETSGDNKSLKGISRQSRFGSQLDIKM